MRPENDKEIVIFEARSAKKIYPFLCWFPVPPTCMRYNRSIEGGVVMDKKLQKKAIHELARDIRTAAVGLCRHHDAKICFVRKDGDMEISVENDGGYRSIIVGDASSKHYSYIFLYQEIAVNGEFRSFRQFPLLKDIEYILSTILGDGKLRVICARSWDDSPRSAEKRARLALQHFVEADMLKLSV